MGMVPSDDISTTSGLTTEYHLTSSDFTQSGGNWTATVDVSALGGYDHMCHMEDSVPAIMYSLDTSSSGSVGITAWDVRPTGVTLVVDKAVPEWQLGLVFTASEDVEQVPAETVTALGGNPTFHSGLFYATYPLDAMFDGIIDGGEDGSSSTVFVECGIPCDVIINENAYSISSGGGDTGASLNPGSNTVSVLFGNEYAWIDPPGFLYEPSATLMWETMEGEGEPETEPEP